MGYDLSNSAGTYVRFTGSGWDLALAVARHYGWEPAGIAKPATWDEKKYGPWEDGYWMNAGQEVTAEDAARLTRKKGSLLIVWGISSDPFFHPTGNTR